MTTLADSPGLDLPADAARPAASVACTHCGLDVPAGLVEPGSAEQFCCSGCRSVYGIIHGAGLDRYYGLRRAVEKGKAAAPGRDGDYAAFDDPALVARLVREDADGTASATLALEGVHCAACVWLIERLGRVVPGVISARAAFARSTVEARWDPSACTLADVARGLHALGYPAGPPRAESRDADRRLDARRQLVRIGVAGALAGNVMLVSVALYAGVFEGIDPALFALFRWVAAGLAVVSLVWPGRVFFRGAIAAARTRTPHLDVPIAIALLVGGVWGVANTLRGVGEIYFDSLTTLVFFLLVGRFVQSHQQRRAADALDLLLTIAPGTARVVGPRGAVSLRPVEAVAPGAVAEVRPGETVPIDGVVVSGESELDRSVLTGESRPVAVGPGETAHAGTVNLAATLRLRVEAVGAETRAGRLMRLVAEAASAKAPVVQLADRAAGWFVVVVSSLAVLTAAAWAFIEPAAAIDHATALLIVTCPCALGLATPLVLSAAIGRFARAGVLVKGGAAVERLAGPGLMLLDKTGTLTTGTMTVAGCNAPEPTRLRVAALERGATHPIARAIAASCDAGGLSADAAEHRRGLGAAGEVAGRRVAAGSPAFLEGLGVETRPEDAAWASSAARDGLTPVLIAEDGRTVGGVALHDALRPEAAGLVEHLRRRGWRVGLLSGDDPAVVARVAEQLGIDPGHARGRVTPEGKRDAVLAAAAEAQGRPVVMVGDGVNDAAALAAADVGIAVSGGADASLDAADISMQRGGLSEIAHAVDRSRAAMRRIRLCMACSLGYNAIAAGLAVAGLVHPLLAAVLMPLSSLTVVAIAASSPKEARACP